MVRPRLPLAFFPWSALVLVLGCAQQTGSYERFIPEPEVARAALKASLEAWVEGKPIKPAMLQHPKVEFVDRRRESLRLLKFEIVGEVIAESARGFAVRLSFADSDEQTISRYLVVGIDPVWVYRQEDFETIMHWMNDMRETGESPRANP